MRAVVPFAPVKCRDKILVPGQSNNVCIFPAIGLAVYATGARRVTAEMFMAAAHAISEQVTEADLEAGLIYPPASNLLAVEAHAARRVAEVVFARGLARAVRPDDLESFIRSKIYQPAYASLI